MLLLFGDCSCALNNGSVLNADRHESYMRDLEQRGLFGKDFKQTVSDGNWSSSGKGLGPAEQG